jgi:hypothetical protein
MVKREGGEIGDDQTPLVGLQGLRGCAIFDRVEQHSTLSIAPCQRLRGWVREQSVIRDHHQIRLGDGTALKDLLTVYTGKRRHRSTPSLGPVQRGILDDKSSVKSG